MCSKGIILIQNQEFVIIERHKMKLEDIINIIPGTPQFRIKESLQISAPNYYFYGQQELENDLTGVMLNKENSKTISTMDNLNLVCEGDILFSLISGKTTIVRKKHNGYLYTQNYVKLIPEDKLDSKYLVYLLNESDFIRKQWLKGLQGSAVLKHTVKQLRELELPNMHTYDKQKIIGDIYFNQQQLSALRMRVANTEQILLIEKLKGVTK